MIEKPAWSHYEYGDYVTKRSGSRWRGRVVGWYSTSTTPCGICVESANEPGSTQIYPQRAFDPWKDAPK